MRAGTVTRNRRDGRYTDSRLEKRCVCGHPLGAHSAERVGPEQPCGIDDCPCESFTKTTTRQKGGAQ